VTIVSLVIGANRGIGREVACQLAERGHHVLVGGRDFAKAKRAAHGFLCQGEPIAW